MEDNDPDTNKTHVAPIGMEHQGRRQNGKGRWYAGGKLFHHIICLHQKEFPELAEKMKNSPDATNIYTAFLCMLPLEVKGRLTPDLRRKILKTYKLL